VVLAGQGAWVYFTLFCIFFSETGLVFMAFLPGDSLLFVAGAVAATGAMNIWVLMLVTLRAPCWATRSTTTSATARSQGLWTARLAGSIR